MIGKSLLLAYRGAEKAKNSISETLGEGHSNNKPKAGQAEQPWLVILLEEGICTPNSKHRAQQPCKSRRKKTLYQEVECSIHHTFKCLFKLPLIQCYTMHNLMCT